MSVCGQYVCVSHSLQHSPWISLLFEGGPNIFAVQGLLPRASECKCVLLQCLSRPLAADTHGRDSKVDKVCVCVVLSMKCHLALDETVNVGQHSSDPQAARCTPLNLSLTAKEIHQ